MLDGPTSEVFAKQIFCKDIYYSPQITQLAQRISKKMGISSRALSVEELGEDILAFLNSKQKSAVVP